MINTSLILRWTWSKIVISHGFVGFPEAQKLGLRCLRAADLSWKISWWSCFFGAGWVCFDLLIVNWLVLAHILKVHLGYNPMLVGNVGYCYVHFPVLLLISHCACETNIQGFFFCSLLPDLEGIQPSCWLVAVKSPGSKTKTTVFPIQHSCSVMFHQKLLYSTQAILCIFSVWSFPKNMGYPQIINFGIFHEINHLGYIYGNPHL